MLRNASARGVALALLGALLISGVAHAQGGSWYSAVIPFRFTASGGGGTVDSMSVIHNAAVAETTSAFVLDHWAPSQTGSDSTLAFVFTLEPKASSTANSYTSNRWSNDITSRSTAPNITVQVSPNGSDWAAVAGAVATTYLGTENGTTDCTQYVVSMPRGSTYKLLAGQIRVVTAAWTINGEFEAKIGYFTIPTGYR